LKQDKWPLLGSVPPGAQKYRWLKHTPPHGLYSPSSLMATLVEFALKEEPLDVEKMRKCLLKQVRLLDTLLLPLHGPFRAVVLHCWVVTP